MKGGSRSQRRAFWVESLECISTTSFWEMVPLEVDGVSTWSCSSITVIADIHRNRGAKKNAFGMGTLKIGFYNCDKQYAMPRKGGKRAGSKVA